jgi:hypothetical protein
MCTRAAASYTVCTTASPELPSPLARRQAVHLTTKRQILSFQTHNRPIQTTCWRHITLHVKLQPYALSHAHKSPSLRITQTQPTALLPRYLTTPNTRRLPSAARWVRSFTHSIIHDARKQGPIQFCRFVVADSLNVTY